MTLDEIKKDLAEFDRLAKLSEEVTNEYFKKQGAAKKDVFYMSMRTMEEMADISVKYIKLTTKMGYNFDYSNIVNVLRFCVAISERK